MDTGSLATTVLLGLLCYLSLLVFGQAQTISVIRIAQGKYEAVEGRHDEAIATSVLKNDVNETGWALLEVRGNSSATDDEMAYAAGYAEGLLTAELIYMSYMNSFNNKLYCGHQSQYCDKLRDFLAKNQQYMAQEMARNPESQFWHQVNLYQQQLKGLRDGYSNNTKAPPLPDESFLFIQIAQDLDDLEELLKADQWEKNPFFSEEKSKPGHCSALIKVLPGNADLYVSHDSWINYHTMLRVLKLYDLPYHTTPHSSTVVASHSVAMSSYPGKLQSEDDYYLCSSGLATMETTNLYTNLDLLSDITPEGVFEPIRAMVANRLARTGRDWVQTFATDNSGTYNNQWMVVDYKLFTAGKDLPSANLLWVLEQLPGMIVFGDQTRVLRDKTYWASYNIPYYSTIYHASGNAEQARKYGNLFSHDKCPRAKIFARNHTDVHDMDSLLALMRYNNYLHDPLSACKECNPPYSATNAIAARADLNPVNSTHPPGIFLGHLCFGATDNKATSSKMMDSLSFTAVCGPTHQQQPVFQWSTAGFGDKPMGQPDRFDFKPIVVDWSKLHSNR